MGRFDGDEDERFFLRHLQAVQGTEAWYRNQGLLGRGGNGTAFLVTCTDGEYFGVQFALKVFHRIRNSSRLAAFGREVAHLHNLVHPAIVRVFDSGIYEVSAERRYPFVVMEYVPSTLRDLIARGPISKVQVVRLAMHCLSALRYMHREGVVHRDIKPENILLSDGIARLADFGLAKAIEQADPDADDAEIYLTQWPGMPYRYRTPELVERARDRRDGYRPIELTTMTDIYQFGTVMYEMLTSYNPQLRPQLSLDDIELDVRPIRGTCGVDLENLVRDMLEEKPRCRPDAHDCLVRLNRIHGELCRGVMELEGRIL